MGRIFFLFMGRGGGRTRAPLRMSHGRVMVSDEGGLTMISLDIIISAFGEIREEGEMKEEDVKGQMGRAVEECLGRVPFVRGVQRVDDVVFRVRMDGAEWEMVVQPRASGQPRVAREALARLGAVKGRYRVFMAPYVSDRAARICEQEGAGYIDLAGNCRLCFDGIYIEERGRKNPYSERRELRSLFSPRAKRILRVLACHPGRRWKVKQLAVQAGVSLGLVSAVKRRLEQREWIEEGMRLVQPRDLLETWAREYRYERNRVQQYYSDRDVSELEQLLGGECVLTGFSAAARYAVGVRYLRVMAYVEDAGPVVQRYGLEPVDSGANVLLIEPYDEGVTYGAHVGDAIRVVSSVQAYLDLMQQPQRGEEAARALLEQSILASWQ